MIKIKKRKIIFLKVIFVIFTKIQKMRIIILSNFPKKKILTKRKKTKKTSKKKIYYLDDIQKEEIPKEDI